MNTKRLKEYLKEIDRLREIDRVTTIKINQQFKDRKEAEERNKKININYVSNCCNFGLDESNLICLKCFEGCEPIQEETQTNNFDNRLINFINNLK